MAGITRITLRYTLADQDALNSFYWVGDDANITDAEDLAQYFSSAMVAAFDAFWHNAFSWGTATANLWTATPGSPLNPGIPLSVAPGQGNVNDQQLPQGTSVLCNFKTYGQPPNRKRLYVGGFTNNNNIAGTPSDALMAAARDFIEDMLATAVVNAHDYIPAVVRLDENGAYVSHNTLQVGFPSENWARLSSRRSR